MGRRGARTQVFDGVAYFRGSDRRVLAELAPHTDRVRVPSGTVLAAAGRPAHQLVVLLDGTARAHAGGRTGTVAAGEAIAPVAVASLGSFAATVTAASDAEVLVVNGPAFVGATRQHPALVPAPVPARAHRPTAPPSHPRTGRGRRAWHRLRRFAARLDASPASPTRAGADHARTDHARTASLAGRIGPIGR